MLATFMQRFRAHATGFAKVLAVGAALGLPTVALAQQGGGQALACLQLVEALANEGRVPLQGVHFEFNRASLRPDSLPALVAARDAILTLGGTWRFEGHTDTVGSRDYNQRLSEARALAVRDWMIGAGIDPARVSFEGFSFDRPIADNTTEAGRALNRRVELVGVVNAEMLGFGGAAGIDPCPDKLVPGTHGATAEAEAPPPPPPVTEWTGAGGQEWLPFSYLMATGDGAGGWEGAVVPLARGSQPQACQALCAAEERCAGFSFKPFGSYFIDEVQCTLLGYGGERTIERSNTYFEGGTFHVSGFKTDARILTAESEAVAAQILADMAEIAQLRAAASLTAATEAPADAWLDVTLDGHVSSDRYPSYVEIAEMEDFDFSWSNSRTSLHVHDMADGRSGRIWTPEVGDYVLRYVIDHPTAGRHTITSQVLMVRAGASQMAAPTAQTNQSSTASARTAGTIEPNFDRPGMDLAQTPLTVADPLACQALCAADKACAAWTYVNPGVQGEQAICWTKSGVPDGFANPCCTSGVMDVADGPQAGSSPLPASPALSASLTAPMVVAPGEAFEVIYQGPLFNGDWIDMIAPGNEADMSGGFGWAWTTGGPVTLTAPQSEGAYTLRYVAEHPQQGRIVLAREELVVRVTPPEIVAASEIHRRCDAPPMTPCEITVPEHDVVLTLTGGFGITEPLRHETAGAVVAERPSFGVVRLADGAVVMTVNARQRSGVYCQQGLVGDRLCMTAALDSSEGLLAGVVFGSLVSHDFHANTLAGGEDEESERSDLQGIWTLAASEGPETRRDTMRLGPQALGGASGDAMGELPPESRAFVEMLGRAMDAAAGTLGSGDAGPGGDAAAILGQMFGTPPASDAATVSSPQMELLGGTPLQLTAEEAIELVAPQLRN